MPHLVILYTPNLDKPAAEGGVDMTGLCRALCDTMLAVRDEQDRQVFPHGGTRVFAYPAAHSAVSDGGAAGIEAGLGGDYAFVYINAKIAEGRSAAAKTRAGDAMMEKVKARFAALFAKRLIGITLQIEESPGQVYDAKHNNLHPLFKK